jgi:cytochrome c-type biogenesis protein CcmH
MTLFLFIAGILAVLSLLLLTGFGIPARSEGHARPSLGLVVVLVAGVILIVGGGYAWIGSPLLLPVNPQALAPGAAASDAAAAAGAVADTLRRMAEASPQDAGLQVQWARAELERGQVREAVEGYRRAVMLRPRDADLLVEAAVVDAKAAGDDLSGEPARLLDRALAINPNHVDALFLKGKEAAQRHDFRTALQSWNRAIQVAPAGDATAAYLSRQLNAMREAAGAATADAAASAPAQAASR